MKTHPAFLGLGLAVGVAVATVTAPSGRADPRVSLTPAVPTTTPIKHLVVIFDENISFDHYFGTYPVATNPPGEPAFTATRNTPHVNGLNDSLRTRNPNATNPTNGAGASNPFRLDRTQAATADQGHAYAPEERAYDDGRADLFPRYTGKAGTGGSSAFSTTGLVMGYFDGNTVTALWNYAQHFAMSDNAYGDQYGPSTPGALDLIAGQTNGVAVTLGKTPSALADGQGGATLIGDIDPAGDSCSSRVRQVAMWGTTIGDLLNSAGVSWGWFSGGFDLTVTNPNGTTACKRSTYSGQTARNEDDYVPHHEPFQYYRSTANPLHVRPPSMAVVGIANDGGANHQYDLRDFYAAVRGGNFPAVSFLKPVGFQDAHAGNSDPLDEQQWVVELINFLEQQPDWSSTAVVIMYDDSDGWYDHQMAPITNASFDSAADQLSAPGACGIRGQTPQLGGVWSNAPVNGRCGPGTRQPFLVISPWSRANYVDHSLITQSSVLRFIEDNWLGGERLGGGSFDATAGSISGLFDFAHHGTNPPLYLDPALGTVLSAPPREQHP